jgi:methionyl-tRNA formyltransferase
MNKKICVIVFSSDKFFLEISNCLKKNDISIEGLVTESPKPSGRGLEVKNNPAHQYALDQGITIFANEKLDSNFYGELAAHVEKLKSNFTVIGLVFAYGKIIPQQIIDLFEDKIINIHPSLLPKHRGASPIQQTILDGDKTTGYSMIKICKRMDAGEIIAQESLDVDESDNFLSLRKKILDKALKNLANIIKSFADNSIKSIPQQEGLSSYSKIIKKNDGQIIESDNCSSALRKIKAFALWPKAFFMISDKRYIIHEAQAKNDKLFISKIQPENKTVMSGRDFMNGYKNLLTYFPEYVRFFSAES